MTLEEIYKKYRVRSGNHTGQIREFLKDAYKTWNREDGDLIPKVHIGRASIDTREKASTRKRSASPLPRKTEFRRK